MRQAPGTTAEDAPCHLQRFVRVQFRISGQTPEQAFFFSPYAYQIHGRDPNSDCGDPSRQESLFLFFLCGLPTFQSSSTVSILAASGFPAQDLGATSLGPWGALAVDRDQISLSNTVFSLQDFTIHTIEPAQDWLQGRSKIPTPIGQSTFTFAPSESRSDRPQEYEYDGTPCKNGSTIHCGAFGENEGPSRSDTHSCTPLSQTCTPLNLKQMNCLLSRYLTGTLNRCWL